MGMSTLSIWVRDTAHPCLPYESTKHSWLAIIMTCDLQLLNFGSVKNGLFPLTTPGKLGGKVHGQVRVPPGCYIVVGVGTCKNVFTDFAMVQAGCNMETCVNLLPKAASTCLGQIIATIKVAQAIGVNNYSFGCPVGREIPEEVLSNALNSLEKLREFLPEDTVTPKIISMEKLIALATEKQL